MKLNFIILIKLIRSSILIPQQKVMLNYNFKSNNSVRMIK